jgi:bifunctional DNase/RNase
MVLMELSRIVIQETSDSQMIVLTEVDGERSFPIIIGIFEAAAIDRRVKNFRAIRPLTHDLITAVIEAMGGQLLRVEVNDLRDNTFYARLMIDMDGREIEVDARPSDAIAVAVQRDVPIYVEEFVLDDASANSF